MQFVIPLRKKITLNMHLRRRIDHCHHRPPEEIQDGIFLIRQGNADSDLERCQDFLESPPTEVFVDVSPRNIHFGNSYIIIEQPAILKYRSVSLVQKSSAAASSLQLSMLTAHTPCLQTSPADINNP